ncbi:hypothetical protein PDESU_02070 [Pontiella desulfatans]|uniref:tRNA uridine 5-carboxymethylaminomethyl modification enzyme MnmG n=1 Tax=Pontiella desulfatans TaxID=2750659 RepID=A0A6C2U0V8_PONDE|nr:FAD-dependent oxidoreductase [Pontiella desulfatans]VGO13513.1 hypothetical protein PDESU_02070 [Pontiella desulfatans]
MNRREFTRIVGGTSVVTALAPNYLFAKNTLSSAGVLLEACTFKNRGGWKLDTQFYQQMGGCYLLAHGMGKPVVDAMTDVTIPKDGKWYVFVRTKDWCPGNWDAPGQFKVAINGKALDTTFGTEKGWAWQSGGKVALKAGTNTVTLKDLTGFEGRIDAVYFSKEKNPKLPSTPADVMGWKDQLSGRSKLTVKTEQYELVVVGGGMSGCAAALAAAEKGVKVALIHDRPVFGGNASAEIRVHTLGIHGKSKRLIDKIDTEHWPNGDARAIQDQKKREASMKASEVALFANHLAIGLEKDGDTIVSVDARDSRTGVIRRFKAAQFIDATGDGWLGYWSGATCRYGREAASEFGEEWAEHGDLWSPKVADNRVMGTSILWNSKQGQTKSTFPEVPWAQPVSKDSAKINGEWFWEYSDNDLHQIRDAEQIRDHMFRAIYGNFSNAKKLTENDLVELKWVAYIGGRRESRRIMGDHIFTMSDCRSGIEFPDSVVEEVRPMDGHYQQSETGLKYSYISKAMHFRGTYKGEKIKRKTYYIPFRSLYAKDINNLMMAGRCFSCSHIGLGGPRVMNTCAQMGVATGCAASLCIQHNANPRAIGKDHIKALRKMIGYTAKG